jgi:hypothetical protein
VYSPAGSVPPPSHLTSYTSTRSNLYLASSLETVIMEPALYKLLTFHNPNLISIFFPLLGSFIQRIRPGPRLYRNCLKKFIFYDEGLLAPLPTPKSWRTTPCRLSAAAYSICSQLPSICGGRSSFHNLRTLHAVVAGTPNIVCKKIILKLLLKK